jgi:hypothetical protein
MNCRHIIRCYFSVLVGFLFLPQPKVLSETTLPGCETPLDMPSIILGKEKIQLTAREIIDDSDGIAQVTTQAELLAAKTPYKPIATRDIEWRMRITKSDFDSVDGKTAKYKLINSDNKLGNPFKNYVTVKSSKVIQRFETCSKDNTETFVITGEFTLEFRELSQFVPGRFATKVEVCLPRSSDICSS